MLSLSLPVVISVSEVSGLPLKTKQQNKNNQRITDTLNKQTEKEPNHRETNNKVDNVLKRTDKELMSHLKCVVLMTFMTFIFLPGYHRASINTRKII